MGCFVQWSGGKCSTRLPYLSPRRAVFLVLLLFCTSVGAVSPPSSDDLIHASLRPPWREPWSNHTPDNSTCVFTTGVAPVVRPATPQFGASITDSTSQPVFMDARHSMQLTASLLVMSGVEQNPGPGPVTRQTTLDGGNPLWSLVGQTPADSTPAAAAAAAFVIADQTHQKATTTTNNKQSAPDSPDPSLGDIMTELRAMRAEMRGDVKKVQQDVASNKAHIAEVSDRQTQLEEENRNLRHKVGFLEDHNRRNNLIVGGVPETAGPESWEATEAKVRHSLVSDLRMDNNTVSGLTIDRTQRLGKRAPGTTRPIKVSFITNKDKMLVLKRARELKPETPYIREDFSPSTLEARSKLKPGLLTARANDKQAYLVYDKLIVQCGDKKNVYRYDRNSAQVTTMSHNFDDSIHWPQAAENNR